jgi:hypothetical protein
LSSPACSAEAGLYGRGPRPRRGGRRRSFMQLSVRVNTRGSRLGAHVLSHAMVQVASSLRSNIGDGATRQRAMRNTRWDNGMRRDSVLCLGSSAGADLTRGAGRWSYRGAALRLASCTRRRRATGIATHRCSASRTRQRDRTAGHIEYRQCTRFAQPGAEGANFMPPPAPGNETPHEGGRFALNPGAAPRRRRGAVPPPPPAVPAPPAARPRRAPRLPAAPTPAAAPRRAAP